MVLVRELVEELHAYAIDFVVDVEARFEESVWEVGGGDKGRANMERAPFYVAAVRGHDYVYEVVDGCWICQPFR